MTRIRAQWGMAFAGLVACAALTVMVGHSIGEDDPDVTELTRPKKPKPRVYDSRIQMHRMDWTFEGEEALYRRNKKKQTRPDLPPEARNAAPEIDSDLRHDATYERAPTVSQDLIEENKRNWILPPASDEAEESPASESPWDFLKLEQPENADDPNPYTRAGNEETLTPQETEQKYREITDNLLMSEEDMAALAAKAVEEDLRSSADDTEYTPVVSGSTFGSDYRAGASLISRDEDTEDEDAYADAEGNEGTDSLGAADASESSLSARLGIGRTGDQLHLTRKNLGFSSDDPDAESDGETPDRRSGLVRAPDDGWRGVFKGIGGNLPPADVERESSVVTDTSEYRPETAVVTSTFIPRQTSDAYRDAFSAGSFSPAGPSGNADIDTGSSFGGTEFGPTTVDRFSFSKPAMGSDGFDLMGDGQQRLLERTGDKGTATRDPFSTFQGGPSDPTSTSTPANNSFPLLLR